MSLLAGIRFSKRDGGKVNASTDGVATAAASSPPVSVTPAEAQERRAAEEEEIVQREIKAGLRDPGSGRPFGLHKPGGSGGAVAAAAEGPAPVAVAVGDRGADWRARALKRAREQAEKSGRSIEEVVAERWGSVAELRGGSERGGGGGRVGRREQERYRESLVALGRGEMPGLPDSGTGGIGGRTAEGGYGGRNNRKNRGLRIGRDARDTDVLRRFSDKLGAAMEGLPRDSGKWAGKEEGAEDEEKEKGGRRPAGSSNSLRHSSSRTGGEEDGEKRQGLESRSDGGAGGGGAGGSGSGGGHGTRRSRSRDAERRPPSGRADSLQRSRRRPSRSASPQRKRQFRGFDVATPAHNRGGEDQGSGSNAAQFGDRDNGGSGGGRHDRRSDSSWQRGGGRSGGGGRGDDKEDGGGGGGSGGDEKRARGRSGLGWQGDSAGRDRANSGSLEGPPPAASESVRSRRHIEAPAQSEPAKDAPSRTAAAKSSAAAAAGVAAAANAVPEAVPEASNDDAADDAAAAKAVAPLSLAEINALAAAAMRARLKGDTATHARLYEQVEKAKANAPAAAPAARTVPASAAASAAAAAPAGATRNLSALAHQPVAPGASPSMADINAMAAAAMRARLTGDSATHAHLMEQVKRAKASAAQGSAAPAPAKLASANSAGESSWRTAPAAEDVEVFTATDSRGRPVTGLGAPAALRREDLRSGARKGKLKQSKTDMEAAAAGGGGQDLQAFLRTERERGAGDMDEAFARNVVRLGSRFKGTELGGKGAAGAASGFDEDDEIDVRMFDRPDDRLTEAAVQARQRQAAIAEHKRMEAVTGGCTLCVGGRGSDKRLLVALGEKTALRVLPPGDRLVEGHCRVAPLAHVATGRACDEDVWEEVEKFKRGLRAMAAAAGDRMIFIETAVGLRSAPHAFIEAVPVPKDVEMDAPLYFKQALLAAGDEWSTHRKVIETKRSSGGIRGAVPEGFPYFHVEWEGGDGYAQVIEDEAAWPRLFGLETLAGMLGVDPPGFGRGGSRRRGSGSGGSGSGSSSGGGGRGGDDVTRQATLSFLEKWRPHDWTAELDGGEFVEGGK